MAGYPHSASRIGSLEIEFVRMELFLNLLWLLIAVVSVAYWRRHAPPDAAKRRPQCIALACALLLLFPVISLTDDLHAEVMLVEDGNTAKRHAGSAAGAAGHASHGKHIAHSAVAVTPPRKILPGLAAFGSVSLETLLFSSFRVSPASGRDPPSFSL
jgi:hypothetical protein